MNKRTHQTSYEDHYPALEKKGGEQTECGVTVIDRNTYKKQTIKPHRNTLQNIYSPDIEPGKPTPAS